MLCVTLDMLYNFEIHVTCGDVFGFFLLLWVFQILDLMAQAILSLDGTTFEFFFSVLQC